MNSICDVYYCIRYTSYLEKSHYKVLIRKSFPNVRAVIAYPYLIETVNEPTGRETKVYKYSSEYQNRKFIAKYPELPITSEVDMIKRIERLLAFT
jgi:hypothetical protein